METTGQIIASGIAGVAGFLLIWAFTRAYAILDKIGEDLTRIPEKYVAKDDYREDIREIKETLGAIWKRLENKAEK